jgi:hypothetical protein
MEQDEDRSPAIEEQLVAPPTEASLRLQLTDLFLGRAMYEWAGRSGSRATFCNRSKRRWRPTVATSTRPRTAKETVTVRRPEEERMPAALRMSGV